MNKNKVNKNKTNISFKNWQVMYAKLHKYQLKNHVPSPRLKENSKLYFWYSYNRQLFETGKLESKRLGLWKKLPFYNALLKKNKQDLWLENYNRLKLFQEQTGEPWPNWQEDKRLFDWAWKNKNRYKCGIMAPEMKIKWEKLLIPGDRN